jgi:hypothetical protein
MYIINMIPQLRKAIPQEEFDYGLLMYALSSLKNPRQKVTAMLQQGHIIRVKKGIYAWGEPWRRRPIQLEILANLIYGPSIVSSDWALSFHGLIPERVTVITSTGPKAPVEFQTPVGRFHYRRVPMAYAPLGMQRMEVHGTGFLIASAERALCDRLLEIPELYRPSQREMASLLKEELRLDEDVLTKMDPDLLAKLAEASQSPRIHQLYAVLRDRLGKE